MSLELHFALDEHKNELHISEATSGANGYFCIDCGRELVAHKGNINQHHFKHHLRYAVHELRCTFSNETHRHKLAKAILQQLKRISVPPVYELAPEGFRRRQLLPATTITAHTVAIERNIFESGEGTVCFESSPDGHFDTQNGTRELLIRPDVLFLDAHGRILLLIELHVTHAVDERKLLKLRRLGRNTVEVHIPRTADTAGIEQLFSTTQHTTWIYHEQQYRTPFDPTTALPAAGSNVPAGDGARLFERPETHRCRKLWLAAAIRGIKKFADSHLYATATEPHSEVEKSFRKELRERSERVDAAVRARVEQKEADFATAAAELQDEEEVLGDDFRREKERIQTVTAYARKRITLGTQGVADTREQWRLESGATEAELRAAEHRLSIERDGWEAESRRLDEEEAELRAAEAAVSREQTRIEREEATVRAAAAAEQQRIEEREGVLAACGEEIRGVQERSRALRQIKEDAGRRRPTQPSGVPGR